MGLMISHEEKTIIAQCTPKGSGSIALIRISGSMAIYIADKISKLPSNLKLLNVNSHTIHYGWIIDDQNNIIDQVMFIVMKSPKTFTGEDIVEITCHNNPFIIEQIILLAIENGARLAQQGEFSKRAFLNGKIDLIQAEAINELIHSHTQQALKKSLAQLEGSFSQWIDQIEQKLTKCMVLSEASFEFLDDEMEFGPQINEYIKNIISEITNIKKKFNHQQQIKEGIRIALIGSVNAGKSSIFNSLLKKNRSIVTNIAGTTRDSIEAGIYHQDYYLTIIDTAGLRKTDDIVEKEGITRSMQEAHKADIILLVFDGSKQLINSEWKIYSEIIENYKSKIIPIINKCDLDQKIDKRFGNSINISTLMPESIIILEQKIKEKIDELLEKSDSPFLINQRQFTLLADLENKLSDIQNMLKNKIEYELLSIHINEALQSITELTGKNISENTMDTIFKEFCVGK